MKKGQILEGTVKRLEFPNKGIVETEEGVCIVKHVLPGQKIRFMVQKKRAGKGQGRLLEILEKADCETASPCPHFGICGGCSYLNVPYEIQCDIKREQVEKLVRKVLEKQDEPYSMEGIKESPVKYGYRNKMEFTFGDEQKGGELSLGMHKRGSFYDIVTVLDCQIMDEDYRSILKAVRNWGVKKGLPFFHRMSHEGYLRHLLIRKGAKTGEILVALVTTSQMKPDLSEFTEALLKLPLSGKIVGILHTLNDSVADIVRSDDTKLLYGQDYFYEELLGLRFKITEFSFFQTNSVGAETLYQTVRDYLGDAANQKTVFDLYSGTGTIAQLLAGVAGTVVGVEIVEEAVEAAKENAALNGLDNCKFIAGDVLQVLDELTEKPDVIVLDPPRDGVHPKALKKILAYGVEKMVYVSCKPTSLARDLEAFLEAGYMVEKVVCHDQFPWTANIESVILLVNHKVKNHINIGIDVEECREMKKTN